MAVQLLWRRPSLGFMAFHRRGVHVTLGRDKAPTVTHHGQRSRRWREEGEQPSGSVYFAMNTLISSSGADGAPARSSGLHSSSSDGRTGLQEL